MKIAFVEGAFHSEVLSVLAILAAGQDVNVTIYTHEKLRDNLLPAVLTDNRIACLFAQESDNFCQWVYQHIPLNHAFDFIILTSVETYQNDIVDISQRPNVCLYLHTLNNAFSAFWTNLFSPPLSFIAKTSRYLKAKIANNIYSKRTEIIKKYKYYAVTDEQIGNTLHLIFSIPKDNILVIPFYFIPVLKKATSSRRIVIPGTVNTKTRDYCTVIDALSGVNKEVEVFFLGALQDGKVKTRLELLSVTKPNVILRYFESSIDSAQYEEILKSSHFAILPIIPVFEHGISSEIAGVTCLSGSFNDICRGRLPYLYPERLALPSNLVEFGTAYGGRADLKSKIEAWLDSDLIKFEQLFESKSGALGLDNSGKKMIEKLRVIIG